MSEQHPTPPVDWYEDEIDLRELALTLWRGKWVIVLTTLLAAVVALAVSLAMPKQYQAQADIALAQPKLQLNATEGLALQVAVPDLKTVAAMAQAPAVFQRLATDAAVQAAWPDGEAPLTWQGLAGKAEVKEQGKDGLQLLVKDTDPERAALIANRWAALVVERINERYGWAALQAQLAPQVENAQQAYKQAQAAYEQEVSRNQATALQVQLERVKSDLNCVLALQSQLGSLQEDITTFDGYLSHLNEESVLSPGDALALVTLQQRVMTAQKCVPASTTVVIQGTSESIPPGTSAADFYRADTACLQVQWSVEALTSLTVAQASGLLQELDAARRERLKALPEQQASLEAQVGQLEQALEQEQVRLNEARQRRDTAWQTYASLEQLRSQSQILASPENQVALLADEAVAPGAPVAPRTKVNVALAAVLGAIVGVMGVWVKAWWEQE